MELFEWQKLKIIRIKYFFKINKLGNYLTKKGLVNTLIKAKYNNEI